MPRLLTLLLALCGLCLPALADEHRIVSQTVGTDEMLLALAEPGQIASLSHLATEPEFSAVAAQAKRFKQLPKNADVETILALRPTLVLCADFTRAELIAQLHRHHIRVFLITRYATLEDAYTNLRLLAEALGPQAITRAEALIAACKTRTAALKTRLANAKPKRVLAPSTYGVIGGRGTTFQDLCEHAGAENLAATLGNITGHAPPPVEQMLTWPVDAVVVSGSGTLAEALAVYRETSPYQFMPAVKESRAVLLRPHLLSAISHHRIDGYEELARGLHPDLFK